MSYNLDLSNHFYVIRYPFVLNPLSLLSLLFLVYQCSPCCPINGGQFTLCFYKQSGHFKKIFYLFIFRERGREGEREGEEHQCVVASHASLAGNLACNPGMCPDWESNLNPLVLRPTLNPLSYTSQAVSLHFN